MCTFALNPSLLLRAYILMDGITNKEFSRIFFINKTSFFSLLKLDFYSEYKNTTTLHLIKYFSFLHVVHLVCIFFWMTAVYDTNLIRAQGPYLTMYALIHWSNILSKKQSLNSILLIAVSSCWEFFPQSNLAHILQLKQ